MKTKDYEMFSIGQKLGQRDSIFNNCVTVNNNLLLSAIGSIC